MRILVLTSQGSGVGYHRLMLPVYYLEKTYAFFNRFIAGTNLKTLLEKRKKYGFKMVCDIDDYWILDRSHILESVYPTQEIINHIREADLVTCTNERLWNEIRPINSNVAILPNALPYGNDQFTDVREYTDKVKFVYTGSITHEEDIKLVQFPFKKVASDSSLRSKVHFQLCGFDDSIQVNQQGDWYKEIKKVTEDAIYRQEKGLELFEWAVTNYNLFKVNEKRKQLYAGLKM